MAISPVLIAGAVVFAIVVIVGYIIAKKNRLSSNGGFL